MNVMMPSLVLLYVLFIPGLVFAEEVVAPQAGETQHAPAVKRVRPMLPRFEMSEEMKEAMKSDRVGQRYVAELEAWKLAHTKRVTAPLSADGIAQVRVRRASGLGSGSHVSCRSAGSGGSSNLDLFEIVSALESLCEAIQGASVNASPSGYDVVLSLKKPILGVSLLSWYAATLDDALSIIRSVHEGRVEAAIVRTHQPKEEPEPDSKPIKFELESCRECPIMEWVFRVSGKK